MEQQFTAIAPIYDAVMAGIPYRRWVDYVRRIAARHDHHLGRVLDVGCGTGSASVRLAAEGASVTGIDVSAEMIAIAREKARDYSNARFVVMPMQELDLGETFDTAISLFDSVNYVIEPDDLQEAFRRIYRHLDPGGLWMFDMNTPYALEMELFTQDNLDTDEEPKYRWKSHFDWVSRLTTVDMTFFIKQGDTRVTCKETHRQRAYSLDEIDAWLTNAGFEVIDLYDAYTYRAPISVTDRAFFVARRPA